MNRNNSLNLLNYWHTWTPNGGQVFEHAEGLRLLLPPTTRQHYSDAQIDDYGHAEGNLRWQPPLTLTLQARLDASAAWGGTAGFGFWNDPGGSRTRRLALPQVAWFFHAPPPNELALDSVVPGQGWLAMTLDASRWPTKALLPLAPLALPLMWLPPTRRWLWPLGQVAGLRARMAPVRGATDRWREYQIRWRSDRLDFSVDGVAVLQTTLAPQGPLGLVIWIDNQYAVVRPSGRLRSGLVEIERQQHLDIRAVQVRSD